MIAAETARNVLALCSVDGHADYHTLRTSQVDALLVHADRLKYRKPRNANGSRGRYFYAALQRAAKRSE